MTNVSMKQWNLDQWLSEVRISNITQQLIEFQHYGEIFRPHQGAWTRNVFTWKTVGIPNREDAVMMIAILNYYAKVNGLPVMSCQNLREHSEIFFRSPACKPNNGWHLENRELEAICPSSCDEFELIDHVHPHPQEKLYGRKTAMDALLDLMKNHLVTAVVGTAGNGKTALTWHTINQAKEDLGFRCFDWVTDKRVVLNLENEKEEPSKEPGIGEDFESRIIDSMIGRFIKADPTWDKVIDEPPGSRGRKKLCKELLMDGNFLLVIDNIETTEAHNDIVRFLLNLLSGSTWSRAIVTSRVPIEEVSIRGQTTYKLRGLEKRYALEMLNAIQGNFEQKLTIDDCERIVDQTLGNPLFMQIALYRYRREPTKSELERILTDIADGKTKSFPSLFGPLAARLQEKGARWIAMYMAAREGLTTSREMIEQAWRKLYYSKLYGQNPENDPDHIHSTISAIIHELLYYGIISVNPKTPDIYSMHPLIRGYFRGGYEDK